jgi:hypothetical protein
LSTFFFLKFHLAIARRCRRNMFQLLKILKYVSVRRLSLEIAMLAPLGYSGEMGIIDNPLINLLRLLDHWWGLRELRGK